MHRGLAAAQEIKTGEDHVSCFTFYSLVTNTAVGAGEGVCGGRVMVYHMVGLMMTFPVTTAAQWRPCSIKAHEVGVKETMMRL